MEVYIVVFDKVHIVAVFDSKTKAEDCIKREGTLNRHLVKELYKIEERTVE